MNKKTLESLQTHADVIGNSLYTVDLLGRILENTLRFPNKNIQTCEFATIAKVLNNQIKTTQDYTEKFELFVLKLRK